MLTRALTCRRKAQLSKRSLVYLLALGLVVLVHFSVVKTFHRGPRELDGSDSSPSEEASVKVNASQTRLEDKSQAENKTVVESTLSASVPTPLPTFAPSPLTPSAPSQLTPSAPSQLTPSAPSQLTPSAPSQLTPSAPSQLTPSAPSQLTPSAPSPFPTSHLRATSQESQTTSEIKCPEKPSGLIGRIKPHKQPFDPLQLSAALYSLFSLGGQYRPTTCLPSQNTAILIPYRNRSAHLHTLLPVLMPFLIRQNIQFRIFVIEQESNNTFNKGLLFNAGFLESLKLDNFTCFILHDVDMIPVDDHNLYRCHPLGPVHLSPSLDKFGHRLIYNGLFGGVVAFSKEHFRLVNGASNMYFGWGAEDDDLRDRAVHSNLTLFRKSMDVGVYEMIPHGSDGAGWKENPDRYHVFAQRYQRQTLDGLTSAVYNLTSIKLLPLYTVISLNYDRDSLISTVPENLRKSKTPDRNMEETKIKFVNLPT